MGHSKLSNTSHAYLRPQKNGLHVAAVCPRRSKETPHPQDVPPGHLAVKVGEASKRFVIRADYLNHPVIRQLLDQAYEENVHNKSGPLAIPCDEFLF
nr:auxin-responsive protein saur71 [Quercus suber]